MKGYRTYVCALLIGLIAAASYLGYISNQSADVLLGLLGAGGLAALRSSVNR